MDQSHNNQPDGQSSNFESKVRARNQNRIIRQDTCTSDHNSTSGNKKHSTVFKQVGGIEEC